VGAPAPRPRPLKRALSVRGRGDVLKETDITASYAKASYRERVTHFTGSLDFLSDSDKDWVMGRAIPQRLNWS
jgi:hypothetical protein